jgi:NAD(P)-dependent dehydrogenase (short-subunit alcohol dehydrogenase family)
METGLRGKTILVTGAGAGIGFATTRMFIEEGANVVAADRDVAPLTAIEAEAQLAGCEVDLSDPDGPARAVEHAIDACVRRDRFVGGGVSAARDPNMGSRPWDPSEAGGSAGRRPKRLVNPGASRLRRRAANEQR